MASWTREQQLEYLLRRPWSLHLEQDEADVVVRVAELPFVLGVGADLKRAAADLYAALRAGLEAMLEHGDVITLPAGETTPWERGESPPRATVRHHGVIESRGAVLDRVSTTAGSTLAFSLA